MHDEKVKRSVGRPAFKKGKAKRDILKMRVHRLRGQCTNVRLRLRVRLTSLLGYVRL
jgi:hypothetical protein